MQQIDHESIDVTATKWLIHLLELMGYVTSVTAEFVTELNTSNPAESGINCWLTIDSTGLLSTQIEVLIGENGVNLDAIQQLANIALNAHLPIADTHCFFTVELDGYRAKRQAELRQIAENAANQVRLTQSQFEIEALTAAERRLVHMFLKEHPDLETFSQGKEPNRHLIVRLVSELDNEELGDRQSAIVGE